MLVVLPTGDALAARTTVDENGTFLFDGVKTFPLALTLGPPLAGRTPDGLDGLEEVTAAGVNVVRAGPWNEPFTDTVLAATEAMNEAAAARGAYTWVNLRELARAQPGTADEEMLRRVVTTLADDRAVAFWKGADEPWWAGWPASLLTYAYCLTTSRGDPSWCDQSASLDPSRLWVTVQAPRGTPFDLEPYTAVTDVHGVDVYPVGINVPNPDLHQVGEWTRIIESITPNRAVWTTLQVCFNGSASASGAYVLPTREQERYMVYDAIINGARALNFYGGAIPRCFDPGDAELGWNWSFWNAVLESLIVEIGPRGPLYPALLEPRSAIPLVADDPTTEVTSRRVGSDLWVIAARHGPGTANVRIGGLPLREGVTGTVYTEGRWATVRAGSLTDSFTQWGVHVYRLPTGTATGPATSIVSGPTGATRRRAAVFTFSGPRGARFECALDGVSLGSCTSPTAFSELADGEHTFGVRATDIRGRVDLTPAFRSWTIDTAAPTQPSVSALSAFQRASTFPVRWSATDSGSGVASYDVAYRQARADGGLGARRAWKRATRARSATFRGLAGRTYCFSARARDAAGNVSARSGETCTALPLDDRSLAASAGWTRASGRPYYLSTYSLARTRGAELRAAVRAKQLALLVTRCPGCGVATVFWNGRALRRIDLRAGTTRRRVLVPVASFPDLRAGRAVVRVTSTGRPVEIDALGASGA